MTDDQEQKLREWVAGIGGLIWGLSGLGGLGLIGYQCLEWLKAGHWEEYSAIDTFRYLGMDPSQLTWVGLRSIVVWITELPLSLWLIFAPFILFVAANWLVEDHIQEGRQKRGNERG